MRVGLIIIGVLSFVMVSVAACSNAVSPALRGSGAAALPASVDPLGFTGLVAGGQPARYRSGGNAPPHVLTWLTIGEDSGTYKVTPPQVAQWVDWTMTTQPLSLLAKAVGMKTLIYSDPNRVNDQSLIWNNDEKTFAHDCNGNRIPISGSNDYQMDVHTPYLYDKWNYDVNTRLHGQGGGVYDWTFEDSADEINPGRETLPCNFNQQDWTNYTNTMDKQFNHHIIYNGLGLIPGGQSEPGPEIALNQTTDGGMSEDCYVGRTPNGYFYAPHWQATANTEIQMAQAHKYFICHSDYYGDASQNMALRTYFYASFLLTYHLANQLIITEFGTPSGVTVMPEAQFVPEHALISTPSDISGLQEPSGVYGRQYDACYLAGQYVGRCAIVVNPNNPKQNGKSLAFPWPGKYEHTLTMSGYGVYDGGTVSASGPPPPAEMPGGTGVIAIR